MNAKTATLPADLETYLKDTEARERIVRLPGDGFAGRGFIRLTEGGFWRAVSYGNGSVGPFASALDASVWLAGGKAVYFHERADACRDLSACSERGLAVALAEGLCAAEVAP